MKKLTIDSLALLYLTKVIAFIGMLLTVVSLGLAIASIISNTDDSQFGLWVYSVIAALISLFFYAIDGIFCIIRAFYKLDVVFNIILGVIIFISIPMAIYIGGTPLLCVIWNVYYFIMLVLETISIFRAIKHYKAS